MKVAHVRLAAAAVLFLGWIGWLVYLVVNSRNDVILSRPQFLVADMWVIAEVSQKGDRPATDVTIRTLAWSKIKDVQAGKKIVVGNLPEAGPEQGWRGPAEYILPLTETKTDAPGVKPSYQVTRLAAAPFVPAFQILKPSPKKTEMLKLLHNFAKLKPEEALVVLDQSYGEFSNVYEYDIRNIQGEFERLGAVVAPAIRIYLARPEARQQLEGLHQEWRK